MTAESLAEVNRRLDEQARQISDLVRRDVYVVELAAVREDIRDLKNTFDTDRLEARRERSSTRNLVISLSVMIVLSLVANAVVIFRDIGGAG